MELGRVAAPRAAAFKLPFEALTLSLDMLHTDTGTTVQYNKRIGYCARLLAQRKLGFVQNDCKISIYANCDVTFGKPQLEGIGYLMT
jgi:hypothetical protein